MIVVIMIIIMILLFILCLILILLLIQLTNYHLNHLIICQVKEDDEQLQIAVSEWAKIWIQVSQS